MEVKELLNQEDRFICSYISYLVYYKYNSDIQEAKNNMSNIKEDILFSMGTYLTKEEAKAFRTQVIGLVNAYFS